MIAFVLDEKSLETLLSLGGESLRSQLLADLALCHDQLTRACLVAQSAQGSVGQDCRHALHEMRGIALTVGAHDVAALCAEAEALCETCPADMIAEKLSRILEGCNALRSLVASYSWDAP